MINRPEVKQIFAVTKGVYLGEMLAFIDEDKENYNFISLPKNINRTIPKKDFLYGVKKKILDLVEVLPEDIYNVLEAQYTYNEKFNNRRQQHSSQSILDIESTKEDR
jgi:hypothetical protein